MTPRGFTLAEMLISISIIASLSAILVPSYRACTERQAAQIASTILENTCYERKQKAVALTAFSGICLGQTSFRTYEYNPFSSATVSFTATKNLAAMLGIQISCSVTNSAASRLPNPCNPDEQNLAFSPAPNSASDWQGAIAVQAQGETWTMTGQNGAFTDGP